MINIHNHTISTEHTIKDALAKLDSLSGESYLTLFVTDSNNKMVGTITDGDIRRSLLAGQNLSSPVSNSMYSDFVFFREGKYSFDEFNKYKELEKGLVPVLNEDENIIRLIDTANSKAILPIDALIMAGGKGQRLLPLTKNIPKPLLKIGKKPIIEYNIDSLILFGVYNIHISIKYLGEQIVDYFGNGQHKGIRVNYVKEENALGTIGAASLVPKFEHDIVLIMNSDLLTNIDYLGFYNDFISNNADMCIATVPYKVDIPYGVLQTEGNIISSLIEKPTYIYYSNGGIYLIKREHLSKIPIGKHFNATDLMEKLIKEGKKVISYPVRGYWLDIGKPADFQKAQEDVKHIKFY